MNTNYDSYLKIIDLTNSYFFYFNVALFSGEEQHINKFKELSAEILKIVEENLNKSGKPKTPNTAKDIAALQFLNATIDKQCKKFDLTTMTEDFANIVVADVGVLKSVVNELKKYEFSGLIDSFPHLQELIQSYKFQYPC